MIQLKKKDEREVIVVKPVWWRQAAFTTFLFLMAFFFSAYDFKIQFLDHGCVALFGVMGLLNLLDQLFVWSRLRIDSKGYSLRSWFRRIELRRDEVEDFLRSDYLRRTLVLVRLTKSAAKERAVTQPEIPFPCAFGRPVDEVFETLRGTLPEAKA